MSYKKLHGCKIKKANQVSIHVCNNIYLVFLGIIFLKISKNIALQPNKPQKINYFLRNKNKTTFLTTIDKLSDYLKEKTKLQPSDPTVGLPQCLAGTPRRLHSYFHPCQIY